VVTATLAGSPRTNQDHTVVAPHAVAVLDGSTSWLPQDPVHDGGWYARTLGAALTIRLDDARDLADIVADAITDVRDRHSLVPGKAPNSTLTIARWDAEAVQIYVLGDSPAVIYQQNAEPIVMLDDRLEPAGDRWRTAYRERLRAGHGYDEYHNDLIAKVQLAELDQQNQPGGFWIAEADPGSAHQALRATYALDHIDTVLLATDGIATDVTDYRRHTWTEVHQLVRADVGSYLRDIHHAEETDPDGTRWPRAKRHDDKTVAAIHLNLNQVLQVGRL
jgi:hypothetical protein